MNTIQKLVDFFRYVSWIKVIAITGGPCGGKSTFLKMAISLLLKHNIKVFVVPEVARELMSSGIVPWAFSSFVFQKHVFMAILEKEARYFLAVSDMNLEGQQVVFLCDRGLVDGAAYMGEESFKEMLEEFDVPFASVIDRYDAVVHLVTAADGAEEFYVTDDERRETPEEARMIDKKTRDAWQGHMHQSVIDNSTDFPTKINRALLALQRTLPMPAVKEIERKYLILNFSYDRIPKEAKLFEITQIYLRRLDRPGIECRVRKKTTDGSSSFYYTEKIDTEVEGERHEVEEPITQTRYQELLEVYQDPKCKSITKHRYKVPYGSLVVEIDVYHNFLSGLVVMEIEFSSEEQMKAFVPPDWFTVTDVTSQKRYSNRNLAEFGLLQE